MFNFSEESKYLLAMTQTSFDNPTDNSMLTDPTEDDKPQAYLAGDGGFTQSWDTVGAGATIPRQRELNLEERKALL